MAEVVVRRVGPDAAEAVHAVVHAAFAARPALDPPADALAETPASLAGSLAHADPLGGGLVAEADGVVVGALVLDPQPEAGLVWVRRFGVHPDWQAHGVGARMVEAVVAEVGARPVAVLARPELPRSVDFWRHHGFVEVARPAPYVELVRPAHPEPSGPGVLGVHRVVDGDAMRALGRELAGGLRAGDLLVLTGGLGAGKTTLTQGLGEGLGVRGGVTSPTFVIARVHPSEVGGPDLVHVDAYRLGGIAELDDLDLDASLDEAVTVVEWGAGVAEQLAGSWLEVVIERAVGGDEQRPDGSRLGGYRPHGGSVDEEVNRLDADDDADSDADADDVRVVTVTGRGPRWDPQA